MKRLFVLCMMLIMSCIPFLVNSETITITVNNKDYTLIIPDNPKDLRQAYIEISKSYIQTENDNTKLLAITDTLKADVKDLSGRIYDAIKIMDKKVMPEFWQTMLMLNLSYNLQNQIALGNILLGGLIFNKFYIGIEAGYPINVGIVVGWKF
jgi:hypothetical protein